MMSFEHARPRVPRTENDNDRSGIRQIDPSTLGEVTKQFDMSTIQQLDRDIEAAHTDKTRVFSADALKAQNVYRSKNAQAEIIDTYEDARALDRLEALPEPGSRIRITRVPSLDADMRAERRAFAEAMYQKRQLEESLYRPGPYHDVTTPAELDHGMQVFARSEQSPVASPSQGSDRFRDIATDAEKRQGMTVFARAPGTPSEPIEDLTEFAELDEEEDRRIHQQILANINKKADAAEERRFGSVSRFKQAS